MGFLNSLLLFGLLGALVPLLIHLLERRKVPRLDFPSLRFLSSLNRRRMRRLNLQRLLLLLLRMLLVMVLAFALARPTLFGGLASIFPEDSPRSVALLLDASASMTLETEHGDLGAAARRAGDRILAGLGDDDEVLLFSVAGRASNLGGGPLTPALARELLAAWEPEHGSCALRAGLAEAAAAISKRPHLQREIYLLSDFAAAGLDSVATAAELEGLRVFALPLSQEPPPNSGLTALRYPLRPVLPGRPFKLAVAGEQRGDGLAEAFPAELEIGGRHRGGVQLSPGPVGPAWRELSVSLEIEGQQPGIWRKKTDRFALDDELHFVLPVAGRINVLLLSDPELDASSGDGHLSLSAHLERALDPYRGARPEEISLHLAKHSTARLGSSELAGRHLTCIAGGGGLDATRAELLAAWVADGGGLLICPDERGLKDLARHLLPRISGPHSLESGEAGGSFLAEFEPDHPLFAGFTEEHRAVLTGQPLWNVFRTRPGERDVLARFRDGRPALLGWRHGQGRVKILLFEAGPDGGELPYSSMFLPLIQELSQETAGSVTPQLVDVGEPLSWPLREAVGDELQVLAPGERLLQVLVDAGEFPPRAVLPHTDRVGFYALQRRTGGKTELLGLAAARVPVAEGLLTPLPPDSLAGALAVPELVLLKTGDAFESTLQAGRFGKEISRPLLWLAAFLLALELWYSQRTRSAG